MAKDKAPVPVHDELTSKMQLKFENLKILNPEFVAAVNAEIKEALRDCNNRPNLEKARDLNITISFTPEVDKESTDNDVSEVTIRYSVSPVKRPRRIPKMSRVSLNRQDQGFFHADFPTEPGRKGLLDDMVSKG